MNTTLALQDFFRDDTNPFLKHSRPTPGFSFSAEKPGVDLAQFPRELRLRDRREQERG